MENESFGEMLRRLRHEKQVTMAQLAGALAVSVTFVSDVERGRRSAFKAEHIDRAAELLQIDARGLHAAAARERGAVPIDEERLGRAGTQAIAALSRCSLTDDQWEDILSIARLAPLKRKPE